MLMFFVCNLHRIWW